MFDGQDIARLRAPPLRQLPQMQIFPGSYASLNPRMTVGEIIREALDIHAALSQARRREGASMLRASACPR